LEFFGGSSDVLERSLEDVGRFLGSAWEVPERFVRGSWEVRGRFLEGFWEDH